MKVLFLLCLVIFFGYSNAATTQEIAALQELANSCTGTWSSSWNFAGTPDPCDNTWVGITCTGGDVTNIELIDLDTSGTLPTSNAFITGLSNLVTL